MGFKRYYIQETVGYSLDELLVEAMLYEGDEEIDSIRQKLQSTDDPEEKRNLGMELQRLVKQKKNSKNSDNTNKLNKLDNFAIQKKLDPEMVKDIVNKTAPSSKYVDVLLRWWDSGKFKPNDSVLFRQLFVNHSQYGQQLPINKYDDPKPLESALDQIIHKRAQGSITKEINDKPMYSDDNIDVFHGSDRNRCIKYGKGKEHTLCVAQPSSSNLYLGYRSRGATFYFVYFKNEEAERNELKEGVDFIVIHVYPDHMEVNFVEPNHDEHITEQELISKFPVLKPVFDKGIIQHIEHTEDEKRQFDVNKYPSITKAKNYAEVVAYIEMGKYVMGVEWYDLEERGYNIKDLIEKYVSTGVGDVPMNLINKYKLNSRYEEILKRRVDAKEGYKLTPHEYKVIDKMDNKDEILSNIAYDIDLVIQYAKAKNFQNIDPKIIRSIANDMETAKHYIKAKNYENIEPEIITSIARIPRYAIPYAQAKNFKDLEPEIISSIAKDGDYAIQYAQAHEFQNLDPEIIKGIANNSRSSMKYAKAKGFQDIEPQIIQGIASKADAAYVYAREKRFENLEPEIIKGIAREYKYSLKYAKDRNYENIEPEIITTIADDPYSSLQYALSTNSDSLEPEIIQGIMKEPLYIYDYASAKKFQNLPEPIYSVLDIKGNLPPNATMATR